MQTRENEMKKAMLLVCAVATAMMMGQESAQAQCRYGGGGGYGGVSYGSSYGNSFGYSNYSPRSSFSIGFTSAPRVSYQRSAYRAPVSRGHYDYHPTSIYRHRNHYHVQPAHYDFHRGSHRGHRGW